MGRVVEWEQRLQAVIDDVRWKPYHPENWNCCLFAHQCVHALTGTVLPRVWKGSVAETVDGSGLSRINPRQAQRGDLVLADIPEPTVGVCLGIKSAFVGPKGVTQLRTSRATAAWRVG